MSTLQNQGGKILLTLASVLEKIRKGRECIKNGQGVPHHQAKERLSKWLSG
jgi:hypothetical protein